ncbi:MAG: hypothetical protein IJ859_08880 [Synergistaceae bacterium]|nr:hypothetical protein [Synergistaceae bacterium]
MRNTTIQSEAADAIHALNDEDAAMILSLINRLLDHYDLEELTPEEKAELDSLEADDTDSGVPFEVLLEKYGVTV